MNLSPELEAALAAIPNDQKLAQVSAMKAIQRALVAKAVAEFNQGRTGASRR